MFNLSGSFFIGGEMTYEIIFNSFQKSFGTYSKIVNIRPLFFLCGPFVDENNSFDRREILRKYLGNVEINNTYQIKPYALIIDNLFPIIEEEMNITLIEEIISVCSYKTFVFLDTMSTSLEMGLFVNSQNTNSVVALLPNDFQYFKPSLGYFIKQTMDQSVNIKKITYPNKRINKYIRNQAGEVEKVETNLIAFKGRKLPKSITNFISNSIFNLDEFKIDLLISGNISDKKNIIYQQKGNKVIFTIPTNILFFLVNKFHDIQLIKNFLMNHLKNHHFYEFSNVPELYFLFRENRITVEIDSCHNFNIDIVIKNIKYLIKAIESRKIGPQRFKNLQYSNDNESYFYRRINFIDLFGFKIEEWKTLKFYLKFPDKCIQKKIVRINGKNRNIIMYKNNEYGYNLRNLHNKIVLKLENLIKQNNSTFAYKKGLSIKDCIEKHIQNKYFLKLDIKDFFNTIQKRKFIKILKCNLSQNVGITYYNNIIQPIGKRNYIYDSASISSWAEINHFASSLFYESRLPLGYTSSPLISNVYLNIFDERLNDAFTNYNDLVFTRYADDILISSKFEFNQHSILSIIEKELSYLDLIINVKKTKYLILKDSGDHVKYLGLNIVKRDLENEITIGKKYIKDLLKQISNISVDNYDSQIEEVKGKINYIKDISPKEFLFFKNLYRMKNNKEFNISSLLEINPNLNSLEVNGK